MNIENVLQYIAFQLLLVISLHARIYSFILYTLLFYGNCLIHQWRWYTNPFIFNSPQTIFANTPTTFVNWVHIAWELILSWLKTARVCSIICALSSLVLFCTYISSGQNGRHLAGSVFKWIFFNEKFCILMQILLKSVPKGPTDNTAALIHKIHTNFQVENTVLHGWPHVRWNHRWPVDFPR